MTSVQRDRGIQAHFAIPPPFPLPGLLVLALSLLVLAGCRSQSTYPNRPIILVCPWAAGGGTDLVSREVAALLERELDVPVNVLNATGGAGVTGHTRGALAGDLPDRR